MHYSLKNSKDLDALIESIGQSRVVLLGEASHGTHEYYTWRTAISKRLIKEKGFNFIAVEGDWPDCFEINKHVKGYGSKSTIEVLGSFSRWPTWMWSNWEIAALAEWLKDHNGRNADNKAGFYGLDVYSLWESLELMMSFLKKQDPETAKIMKQVVKCFEPYQQEGELYAQLSTTLSSCRKDVLKLLHEVRTKSQDYTGPEASLNAEQNARVLVNAEKYYSSMLRFGNESWNVRDTHMAETLEFLLEKHGEDSKAIVWEHNTHVGDARETNMKGAGIINIGQLARENYREEAVFIVGFGSYKGSVIAGGEWAAPMQEMELPEAKKGSLEQLLHDQDPSDRYYIFKNSIVPEIPDEPLPHRAIGVVYDPDFDRTSNYVPSNVKRRYDAFIYLDETKALHPFVTDADISRTPETYPFGL